MESLERREVPAVFAGLAASLPSPLATQPVAFHVGQVSVASPTAVAAAPMAVAAAPMAATSAFQYTAVTIKNSTNGTVNYSFEWGNGAWTKYSLSPGQLRVHYIRALKQVATISYDKSFAPGIQEQRYTLAGKSITRTPGFYLVEPTPTIGEGQLYTFKGVFNGVQLYS